MERYIKTSTLARIVFDKWKDCEELKQIIPDMRKAVMYESVDGVVSRKVYELALDQLCTVRDQLETEKQLVRDLITELGRRYEQ